MNRATLVTYIALFSTILSATILSPQPDSWGFQTYKISENDRVKADIVRAVLKEAPQVEHFNDLGITIILSDQPLMLSTRNIPEEMTLPTLSAKSIVEDSNSSVYPLPPNYYRLKDNRFTIGFTLVDREIIKGYYINADESMKTRYPLFLEFVHLTIEGDTAYAELGCMGYGGPRPSEWGGCEFWLKKNGNGWFVMSTNIRGI